MSRFLFVAFLLFTAPPALAGPVRSTDPAIAAAVDMTAQRSPTFTALLADIDAAAGIVFVERGRPPRGKLGALIWVPAARTATVTYLRIVVTSDLDGDRLVRVIAHELQHALDALHGRAQTEIAARDTSNRVTRELAEHQP